MSAPDESDIVGTEESLAKMVADLAPGILSANALGFCASAEAVLARSELRAARLEAAARERCRTLLGESRDRGYADGLQRSLSAFLDVEAAVDRLRQDYETALHDMLVVAMETFFETAPHLDLLAQAVAKAVRQRDLHGPATLAVRPDEADGLRDTLAGLPHPVTVTLDEGLPGGEAVLRTGMGEVAISLDRHLALLQRVVARRGAEGDAMSSSAASVDAESVGGD